ncbi:MAG: alpha/beta family hydrolase [Phycisphaeraceae bacterium]
MMNPRAVALRTEVEIQSANVTLTGDVTVPENATGLVVFAHGSGSSRYSPRNRFVADQLNTVGLGTVLVDLLTLDEEFVDRRTAHHRFDINLLADRLIGTIDWLDAHPQTQGLRLGMFGASTGAAAALVAAAERSERVRAVVSRGGRPDLAGQALTQVTAPTLLIVGEADRAVLQLNRQAAEKLSGPHELSIIPKAGHLFEEPGALEQVARLACQWFAEHLGDPSRPCP